VKYICPKCGYFGETNKNLRKATCSNCGHYPLTKAKPKEIYDLKEAIG
jgi:DNA-directed RNA polymerase subunit RPC12/RpoP